MDRADEFAAFYAGAFARLVGQMLLVTGEIHEAEDVVQEAFARASTRRARRRLAAMVRLGPAEPVPPVQVEDLALLETLRGLPVHQRQVIVLHHLLGMPVHEVAATLRVPTGTVKTRLARGRQALAARLTERGNEEVGSHR